MFAARSMIFALSEPCSAVSFGWRAGAAIYWQLPPAARFCDDDGGAGGTCPVAGAPPGMIGVGTIPGGGGGGIEDAIVAEMSALISSAWATDCIGGRPWSAPGG